MDNYNLIKFCDRWLNNHEQYDLNNLDHCFDKFFRLYVVYNALYVEAKNQLKYKGGDQISATHYVVEYLGAGNLLNKLINDINSNDAIEKMKQIIGEKKFYISFDMVSEKYSRTADINLLKKLESTSPQDKAKAILEIIYHTRCNMFHGRKDYVPAQIETLKPLIVILEKVINILYKKIKQH
jgi:hypothetical protein